MGTELRWAVCGLGRIPHKFMDAAAAVPGMRVVACASSDIGRAEAFRERYALEAAYTYDGLAAADNIDAVYVCTNMNLHRPHTLAMLAGGKAVLCEKAFALNKKEAEAMITAAREKQVLLMEAMWTRFLPSAVAVTELVKGGELGELRSLGCQFLIPFDRTENARIFDKSVGGGSVLDLGTYAVSYTHMLAGMPDHAEYSGIVAGGVDTECEMNLFYGKSLTARLNTAAVTERRKCEYLIKGTRGSIFVPAFNAATEFTLKTGKSEKRYTFPEENGFIGEIRHFNELLLTGKKESPVRTFRETLEVMEILTGANDALGVEF